MLATHGVQPGATDADIALKMFSALSDVICCDNGLPTLGERMKGNHEIFLAMLSDSAETRLALVTKVDTPLSHLVAARWLGHEH